MKKITLLTLCYIGLIAHAFGQVTPQNTEAASRESWNNINNSEYYIDYPKNWEIDQSGRYGTSFYLFSYQTSANDLFRENVNLIIQDLTGMDIDLAKYTEISENQINNMMEDGTILENRTISKNGINYQKLIFTGTQQGLFLKFEQFYFIKNNKAYVLTLTCEAKEFNTYKETGEKILNSFYLK